MAHLKDEDIQKLLAQTYDEDAQARAVAVRDLCPCHIKKHIPEVWERMIALADDPDRDVRNQVYHVLGDGSPREYQTTRRLRRIPATSHHMAIWIGGRTVCG